MKLNALLLPLMFPCLLHAEDDKNDLSSKATDPTASLMALNFQSTWNNYHGDLPGNADDSLDFTFRPVIPFTFLEHPNIFRATIPFQTGGRGEEGVGSITLFDLFMTNESWGRWGVGPVMSFDTTGDAPDEFVIGPAVGFVYKVNKQLNLGLFSQNVFAGNTAVTQIQPVIAYQLGDGWSVSAGDLQITYDWEASRWVNLPVGFQIGKVLKLGALPVRLALNPQYNFQNDRGLSEWSCTFTVTALFPTF